MVQTTTLEVTLSFDIIKGVDTLIENFQDRRLTTYHVSISKRYFY